MFSAFLVLLTYLLPYSEMPGPVDLFFEIFDLSSETDVPSCYYTAYQQDSAIVENNGQATEVTCITLRRVAIMRYVNGVSWMQVKGKG